MAFQKYRKFKFAHRDDDPKVTIHADGGLHLTVAAVDRYFEDVDEVVFRIDRDRHLLAFDRDVDDDPDAMTVSSEGHNAARVHGAGVLKELGIDTDRLRDLDRDDRRFSAEYDEQTDYVVLDLSELVDDDDPEPIRDDVERDLALVEQIEADADEIADAIEEADESHEVWCGRCGRGPMSEHGLATHHGLYGHHGERIPLDHEPTPDELVVDEGTAREVYDELTEDTDNSELEENDEPSPGSWDIDSVDDLQRAYDETDSIADAAERFDENYNTVYDALRRHGIHQPTGAYKERKQAASDENENEAATNGDLDLSRYGTSGSSPTPQMVIEALDGAQTVHHVERDLALGRRETEDLLDRLGVLDRLRNGSSKLERGKIEAIVREMVA